MALKKIQDATIEGSRVLARFDFNVPQKNGEITDSSRIDLALPTIKFLLEAGASKLTLMSHLGRPKGQKNDEFSLVNVAAYLSDKLNVEVILTNSAIDNGVKDLLGLKKTRVVLLENLRFHEEETTDDENFARKLSGYGDIFVNDAFGAAHREHASVHIINKFFPTTAYAGLLLQKEIENLDTILNSPKKPFVAIIGGAKVSDKIKVIERLLISVDKLMIGGAMAYPFLKASGHEVGTSLCDAEDVELAKKALKADRGKKIMLPIDHLVSNEFGGDPQGCSEVNIPSDRMGLDIGPKTLEKYSEVLKSAKTVLWNGPMGIFENSDYAKGTFGVCEVIASLEDAFTLVGGGDSVSAANKSGFSEKFSHISTGGGASLEYIEKGKLPGIHALKFGVS